MHSKYELVFCLIIPFNITAQYLENNPFDYYDEIPTSRFNLWGIGSLGFESKINYYNPNYFSSDDKLGIYIYGNLNLPSFRESSNDYYTEHSNELTKENSNIIPNISAHYKLDNFLFNLSYLNTLYFNRKLSNTEGSIYFNNGSGTYRVPFKDPHLRIKNNVFQLSVSMKLSNSTSIAVGLATNVFEYEFSPNQIEIIDNIVINDSYEFGSDLFSNYQFLLNFNYRNPESFSLYILYKTQYTELPLSPSELPVIGPINIKIRPKLTIPATFGFGLQIRIIDPLKASAEFSGNYLFGDNESSDIHNTNIALGLNYRLIDNLHLGIMASYFFDYYNGINLYADGARRFPHYSEPYIEKLNSDYRNSLTLIFNSSYQLINDLELFFGYQYFQMAISNYRDVTNVIYFGAYYSIL